MVSVQQALEDLRDRIAKVIADLEVWSTLHEVQDTLGLPMEDTDKLGKHNYLRKVTTAASDRTIILAAQRMLTSYPGTRGKPSDADLQFLQDTLWWIESRGTQQISNVCRYRIVESLEGVRFWGRLTLREFFAPVLPIAVCGHRSIPEIGDDGYLYEGLANAAFAAAFFGKQISQTQPSRILVAKYLRELGLAEWPDRRFCLLIERLVHPEVQSAQSQKVFVKQFNELLQQDNFELRAESSQGGLSVYKVRKRAAGVSGVPKYIIFASVGLKPDIVINDAVNMDICVVRHAEDCLIYDQPPPLGDLTWQMLIAWWSKLTGINSDNTEIRRNFGERLKASLQSEPERFLFATYFKVFKPIFGSNLPALLPQVYLHYDPRSRGERGEPVLVRQRMDFLMLLRNATRIVIEIDGIQHYSDEKGRASAPRYAEMVAEDRRIRSLGYEVYRFGGVEIVIWDGEKFVVRDSAHEIVVTFFQELFTRHGIHPKAEG